jgi:3-oxoacyl-[acyl-carrier protein] reductase
LICVIFVICGFFLGNRKIFVFMLLQGKRAIVTGAGRGLGSAIALRLAGEGARILVASRSPERVDAAVAEIRRAGGAAEGVAVDLMEPGSSARIVDAASSRLGGIDILVNNAATYIVREFLRITEEDWEATIATNLSAPFRLARDAARVMVRQGTGGAIINIASIHARVAEAEVAPQAAAKAGLLGLTAAASAALRPHGIRVNAVCPGSIEPHSPDRPGASPGEKVTQADVASLVAYLASDLARTITGAVIDIPGGTRTLLAAGE